MIRAYAIEAVRLVAITLSLAALFAGLVVLFHQGV